MSQIPHAIKEYFEAGSLHDTDRLLKTFAPDATVTDEGKTHTGIDEIAAWRRQTSTNYRYRTTLLDVSADGLATYTATATVAGDFPGSPVQLRYRFQLTGSHIGALTITP